MSWVRLPDTLGDEAWALSDGAVRLHVCAVAWSNRTGADGQVGRSRLAAIAPGARSRHARELVGAGWWAERPEGFEIVRHLPLQFTRAEDEHRRETERLKKVIARRGQLGEDTSAERIQLEHHRARARRLRDQREHGASLAMSPRDSAEDSMGDALGITSAPVPVPVPERNEG